MDKECEEKYKDLVNRYGLSQRKSAEGLLELAKVIYDAKNNIPLVYMNFLYKIGYKQDSTHIKKSIVIGRAYERLIGSAINLPPHFESLYLIASMNSLHSYMAIVRREINHKSTLKEIKALKSELSTNKPRRSKIEYRGKPVDKVSFINNLNGPEMSIYFTKDSVIENTEEVNEFFMYIETKCKELNLGLYINRHHPSDLPDITNDEIVVDRAA